MSLRLRLAARNVFRNRARTTVALLAIAAGCAALIVNGGVIEDIFEELREDAILGRHGHIQVSARGFAEGHLRDPGRYLLAHEDAERAITRIESLPHVLRATRRRELTGMIANGDRYVAFLGIGVEPEDDAAMSRHVSLEAGEGLDPEDPYGVVAGIGLAQKFGGAPGTIATLLTHTDSGALNAIDVRLRGVFQGGMKAYDDWTLKLPLATVEELLLDDRTERIVVLLDDTGAVEEVRGAMARAFDEDGLDLETRSWRDLALFHNQTVALFRRELDVIKLIVVTIVVLGIANAIGMSIVERRVELATLRALGLRPTDLARLLWTEALILGVLGAVIGCIAGAAIAASVSAIGIPFPSPPGSTRPFLGGVKFVPAIALQAAALSIVATLLAAALPILRTLRRPIAPTLR